MVKIKNIYKGCFWSLLTIPTFFILRFFYTLKFENDTPARQYVLSMFENNHLLIILFVIMCLSIIFVWFNILIAKVINYFICKKKDPNVKIFKAQELSSTSLFITITFFILIFGSIIYKFYNLYNPEIVNFNTVFRPLLALSIFYIEIYLFGIYLSNKKLWLKILAIILISSVPILIMQLTKTDENLEGKMTKHEWGWSWERDENKK